MERIAKHRIYYKLAECKFLIHYKRATIAASKAIKNAHWLKTPSYKRFENILNKEDES